MNVPRTITRGPHRIFCSLSQSINSAAYRLTLHCQHDGQQFGIFTQISDMALLASADPTETVAHFVETSAAQLERAILLYPFNMYAASLVWPAFPDARNREE